MENKNINNVKVVAPTIEEKKVIKLKELNLDRNQLVEKNPDLAKIQLKSFNEMTSEELSQLHLCKAKVVRIERSDRYTNKKSITYKAMMILVDGIIFEKYLSEEEILTIQNFNPELITEGKSQVFVPVKLITSISKSGNRVFRYVACLSPDVYMGVARKSREGKMINEGFISDKSVNNIISFNLSHKDRAIKFIDVEYDEIEKMNDLIGDIDSYSVDDF